jgi:hypothetical protein
MRFVLISICGCLLMIAAASCGRDGGRRGGGPPPDHDSGDIALDGGTITVLDSGPVGDGTTCEVCASDADCGPGLACVGADFAGGGMVGYACMWRVEAVGGDCTTVRPLRRAELSIDPAGAYVMVCMADDHCTTIRAYMRDCRGTGPFCDGEAICGLIRGTIDCEDDLDCPPDAVCSPEYSACMW